MLSLEQVRGFVAVAEEGNFRRAAERLRMTQPPLSRQIQKLERDVGVLLLDRTQRQVELTPAGVVFLAEARRLLALTEVRLSLSELVSAAQFHELSSGRLDLALARPPFDGAEFAGRRVHREALMLAVPERHRLADRAPIGVPDLDGERMLVYAPGPARYFAELMTRVLAGVSYEPSDRLTQVHTMLALVAAGRGLALVPETAGHLHPDGVRFRPLAGVREQAELYAVWRRDTANPALRRVTDLLEMWPDA
ncbi:LysR family transcriptional regulator [Nocardia terpenica]|uniref:LysR family transcriptional regulator n=2 Tax=Nocardia terpenica TaxID=455432 RepID=A0A6G9ZGS4_9NOCA|nr:LysR substrate-binding domain-containing protein [Nocardia terpenica]QIS24654.1 LysR family transcriptional regulator [Nocardia terpenica]